MIAIDRITASLTAAGKTIAQAEALLDLLGAEVAIGSISATSPEAQALAPAIQNILAQAAQLARTAQAATLQLNPDIN